VAGTELIRGAGGPMIIIGDRRSYGPPLQKIATFNIERQHGREHLFDWIATTEWDVATRGLH
jgi:hypothetical protein